MNNITHYRYKNRAPFQLQTGKSMYKRRYFIWQSGQVVLLSDAVLQLGSTVLVTCFGNETTDENARNTQDILKYYNINVSYTGNHVVMCRTLGTNMACRTLYTSYTGPCPLGTIVFNWLCIVHVFRRRTGDKRGYVANCMCRTLGTNGLMCHTVRTNMAVYFTLWTNVVRCRTW